MLSSQSCVAWISSSQSSLLLVKSKLTLLFSSQLTLTEKASWVASAKSAKASSVVLEWSERALVRELWE